MDLRTKPTVQAGIKIDSEVGDSRFIEYQPGNGTRYRLVLTYTGSFSKEANESLGFTENAGWVISFPWCSYNTVLLANSGGYLAPDWLAGKLGTASMSDALVLAELLGTLTNRSFQPAVEAFENIPS